MVRKTGQSRRKGQERERNGTGRKGTCRREQTGQSRQDRADRTAHTGENKQVRTTRIRKTGQYPTRILGL
jgi:hypothetical protein